MSREVNRRGKKGGHHNSRYGNNSPNYHRHNNYNMGAESSNWREPSGSYSGHHHQQQHSRTVTAQQQQSYGEFLMRCWNEFEQEKSSAENKGSKVKVIGRERETDRASTGDKSNLGQDQTAAS